MFRTAVKRLAFAVAALGVVMVLYPAQGYASGGSGSVDTIKVNKCEYAVVSSGTYVELLISASSSSSGALLLAYLPDGTLLGPVQNGGRYGGTVFLSSYVPATITIQSSSGGQVTVPCTPYQP